MADDLNEPTEPTPSGGQAPDEAPPSNDDRSPLAVQRPVIKKRRSRKERHEEIAQPDEFVEVGGTIIDWLMERGKAVAIILGLVLLALMVGGVQRSLDSSKQSEAAAALFQARELLPSTANTALSGGVSFDIPDSPDDEQRHLAIESAVAGFEAVTTEFSGTPQADQARVLAGQSLYGIGEYERALVFVEAASRASGVAGERAQSLCGASLLALKRASEAVTVYSALRDHTVGATRARATMDLGAAHEAAGDVEAARGIYTLFEEEFPDSDLLAEVKSRASAHAKP